MKSTINLNMLPENPYLLLTPGPLSTSKTVKAAMLQDWCTWDDEYNFNIVQKIRHRLTLLATENSPDYTTVLMQGSGTFAVESVLGSAMGENDKLLVISNGAYGNRMAVIASKLHLHYEVYDENEISSPSVKKVEAFLQTSADITHIAIVHCETTTGILNPVNEIALLAKKMGKTVIVDAMSSFGGIPMDISEMGIDFLVSSANKCIQGVPGFAFIVARRTALEKCRGQARSHALDLYDQWETMECGNGKWRFTSPTHVVRAFIQALDELEYEGGVLKRYERYYTNQKQLVEGMRAAGFETLLPDHLQSPIITSFLSPRSEKYSFEAFYSRLKKEGFVIYPGKISTHDTFRIGNIGEIYSEDIRKLLKRIAQVMDW